MHTIWTIAKKEFKDYFITPIAYIYLITFLVITTWLFLRSFFLAGQGSLRSFFALMPWIYLFFVPAITMGKWSEERKQGTIELLFTLPISKKNILVGKFMAGLGLLTTALFLTFPLPITVSLISKLDWGPVIGGYLGLLFMGGAYTAIGLWISSLTNNQIIAFILGVVACFVLFIIGEPLVTTGLSPLTVSLLQYFGLGTHFESIGRGVVDSRDVIYYLSVIALFLFFNLKSLEGRSKERWILILSVLIGTATLNLLASHHFARLDLTKQKNYTLAPATKEILKNLDDVVTIRLYFTPDLPPALTSVRHDVEDMLAEYKTYAGSHLKVEYYNPQSSPAMEQKVQAMGIPPIELSVIQKDKQEVAKIYLGMTLSFASRQEVLAVIQNTGNLEYRLDAGITKIVQVKKPVLGWWGPATAVMSGQKEEKKEGYDILMERLRQRYEIRAYAPQDIPKVTVDEMPILIVVVPDTLSDAQKKFFTDYLANGGKAIVLAERVSVSKEGLKPTLKENPMSDIFKEYGIEVGKEIVLDRSSATATFTGGVVSYHIPYPFWVKIIPANFDPTQPMVSELGLIILPWPSPIRLSQPLPEGISEATLFKTTQYGMTANANPALPLDPQNTQEAMAQGKPEVIPLGVMLTQKKKEGPTTQLVVVGDSAFVQNQFLELFVENVVFIENAVDVFSTGNRLLEVRSKGGAATSILILKEGQRTMLRFINILLSPLLLIGLGAVIFLWRRKLSFERNC